MGNAVERTGDVRVDTVAPRIRSLKVGRRTLAFKRRGTVRIAVRVDEAATINARIIRGTTVRRLEAVRRARAGTAALAWNGKNSRGRDVRAGRYRLVAEARDEAGNVHVKRAWVRIAR